LFQEQFEAIASVDVVHKDDAFASYELEFEDDIYEEEFINFGTSALDALI
jgi:hypothetical protein